VRRQRLRRHDATGARDEERMAAVEECDPADAGRVRRPGCRLGSCLLDELAPGVTPFGVRRGADAHLGDRAGTDERDRHEREDDLPAQRAKAKAREVHGPAIGARHRAPLTVVDNACCRFSTPIRGVAWSRCRA
jgi:hypothetical protein